jgi:hypothetical protein
MNCLCVGAGITLNSNRKIRRAWRHQKSARESRSREFPAVTSPAVPGSIHLHPESNRLNHQRNWVKIISRSPEADLFALIALLAHLFF